MPRARPSGVSALWIFATPADNSAVTVKLWQLVAVIAGATLLVGIGFGRYVVPNDPVNRTGATFEQHLNDAYTARRGDVKAQQRIEQRYGTTPATAATTPQETSPGDAAAAYVRAAVPGVEAWSADHNGYTGVSVPELQLRYDAGIKNVELLGVTATSYCIQSTVDSVTYHKAGPQGDITRGTC